MPEPKIFKDQLGREVSLPSTPLRIISLVPSQTELLFDLGLNDNIVGVTKYCIHPKELCEGKTKVGGTKKLDIDTIRSLKPDLLIANKEENEQAQIELLSQEFPVWISDIITLDDSYSMIQSISEITNTQPEGDKLIQEIMESFQNLKPLKTPLSAVYLIWRKPYMACGSDNFINEMLKLLGIKNLLESSSRYPEVTTEELLELSPDLILLSSEPFPYSEKHIEEFNNICPDSQVMLVDGEMFSWYGSRLKLAPAYFNSLTFNEKIH